MFQGEDLREALQNISLTAGVPIIPDAMVTGEVYAEIVEAPLETALEIMLAGTQFVAKRTENYYLVADRGLEGPAFPEITETRTLRLNYIHPDTAVKLLAAPLARYVRAENATDPNGLAVFGGAAAGRGGHIVTVTAPPALADRIVADLKRLDSRPRQVLLDARVVVMERGDLLDLGVEWGFPTIRAGMFSGDVLNDAVYTRESLTGFQIGYTPDSTFTDSLLMALHLLQENSQADITSYPQLVAQDGRQSEIRVITEEWFMMEAARNDPDDHAVHRRQQRHHDRTGG
jgi:type II secretory pathway component GspD/PulD (secretin)